MKKRHPFSFILIGVILLSTALIFLVFAFVNQRLYQEARINELVAGKEKEIVGSANYLQSTLSLVQDISIDIAYDWNVISYCDDVEITNSDTRNAAIAKLRGSANSYAYIQSMFLICRERGEVLTSHEGWFSADEFYDAEILDPELLQSSSDTGELIGARSFVNRSGEEVEVVSLVYRLFSLGGREDNYVVANVWVSKLIEAMDVERWEFGNEVTINSSGGSLILDNSEGHIAQLTANMAFQPLAVDESQAIPISLDGEEAILFRWMSESNGWIYVSICTIEDRFMPMTYLRNISMALMVGALLSIALLTVMLISKVYKPYRRIVQKIQRTSILVDGDNALDFDIIEQVMDNAINANQAIQDAYLEGKLIGGHQVDERAMFASWEPKNYRALLFSPIYGEDVDSLTINLELRKLQDLLLSGLFGAQSRLSEDCYRFVKLKNSNLIMLLQMGEDIMDPVNVQLLSDALMQFNYQAACRWAVSVSGPHAHSNTLNSAYEECNRALEFRYFRSDCQVFLYDELKDVPRGSYFADDIKISMLSNNLLSMNYDNARIILHEITDDILENSCKMFYYNVRNIFAQIRDMILKSIHTNGLAEDAALMERENRIASYGNHSPRTMQIELEELDELIECVRLSADARGDASPKSLGSKMREYVQANYHLDISLTSMAMNFGMTEGYLSSRFKEIMGVSFIKYVTKLRIDRTKELLIQDPKMRIADIAESLSMGNAQNLIRVFKKYEGITPGQYRERHST